MSENRKSCKLSVVIPLFNEEENVDALIRQVHTALSALPYPWELIMVDDGSDDSTPDKILNARTAYGEHVNLVVLQRNFGQTAAMQAGFDHAAGDIIATLDGDLQNDPADIPSMVDRLLNDKLDLLVGWRKKRKDHFLIRRVPSWIANKLIARITGVYLHDYGCSLKVYRASVIRRVRLYGEMHRFIPAWAATATSPRKIGEMAVRHHARKAGKSKYGISRSLRVIIDLLAVYFFMRHRSKPGHFFGMIGLVFGFIGGIVMSYLAVVKFYFGEDIGTRPLFLIGIVLIIASVQFFTTGIVAEMLARTYFESSNVKPYVKREEDTRADENEGTWYTGLYKPIPEPHQTEPI
jgi:glycosyltransferase involved in cell wall biosynthesis